VNDTFLYKKEIPKIKMKEEKPHHHKNKKLVYTARL
jgi:hypothetical protein